jgi:RNA polymerase sigma-70 factor (ECF subfamily)
MEIDIEDCYRKYAPMIFRRCLSLLKNEDEALDASQDVFINLLRFRKKLHGQFLSSLLYTMATNTCLNRLRQRNVYSTNFNSTNDSSTIEVGSNDPQFEKVEGNMLIDAIFKDESETTRMICFMYHVDGMTLKEIGDVVGMSISGVRKRLITFNNRAKLKWEGGQL